MQLDAAICWQEISLTAMQLVYLTHLGIHFGFGEACTSCAELLYGAPVECIHSPRPRLAGCSCLSSAQTTVAGPSAPLHVTLGENAGSPIYNIIGDQHRRFCGNKTDGHTFVTDNNFVYISGIADEGPTDLNDKVFSDL